MPVKRSQNSRIFIDSSANKIWLPNWLVNINVALVILTIAIMGQGMMTTGTLSVSVTMIERAFKYNSFQTEFINFLYNIGFAISSFFIGYLVSKNKLRWIGLGAIFMAVGCLVFTIPILIVPLQNEEKEITLTCMTESHIYKEECIHTSIIYLLIMCAAYFLIGIGAAPLHTIAISFLDQHTSDKQGGLFNGIYYSAAAVGPVITFVIFSFVNRLPVHLNKSENEHLTPDSENWIGAGWLVYIVGMILLFLISIPLLLFPDSLPLKKIQNITIGKNIVKNTFWNKLKNTISILIKNWPYVLICLSMFFDGLVINTIALFITKNVETQFRVTSGEAALLGGTVLVVGSFIGLFIGGIIIKIFNWPVQKLMLFTSIMSLLGTIMFIFLYMQCTSINIKGGDLAERRKPNLTNSCSASCNCNHRIFFPVCVDEKETYFSPCELGCSNQYGSAGKLNFKNCSCLANEHNESSIFQGVCNVECNYLIPYMIFGCLAMIVEFIIFVPLITLTMRILDKKVSQFGISLQQIVTRVSFIVGPLIYAPLIDNACVLFNPVSKCQYTSNCLNYDLSKFSFALTVLSISFKFISTLFLFGAYAIIRKGCNLSISESSAAVVSRSYENSSIRNIN